MSNRLHQFINHQAAPPSSRQSAVMARHIFGPADRPQIPSSNSNINIPTQVPKPYLIKKEEPRDLGPLKMTEK